MLELYKSLFARSKLSTLLLTSTFIITLLAIVPAFYVIIVLNKFLTSGVTATLISLTVGTVVSVLFEFALRQNRSKIVTAWLHRESDELIAKLKTKMVGLKLEPPQYNEIVNAVKMIDGTNRNTSASYGLDWPFQLLILIVVYKISWTTGIVVSIFAVIMYMLAEYKQVFRFEENTNYNVDLMLNSLVTVCIIGVGVTQVITGELSTGALIGSNILGSRFVQSANKFFKSKLIIAGRYESIKKLDKFVNGK